MVMVGKWVIGREGQYSGVTLALAPVEAYQLSSLSTMVKRS